MRALDFDAVRELATGLADVQEGASRGARALTVHGKMFACQPTHKSAEPGSLAVRISQDQRAELVASDPDVYYFTEHYANYPTMLVRLSRIHPDALRDLLRMAWQFVAEGGTKARRARRGR